MYCRGMSIGGHLAYADVLLALGYEDQAREESRKAFELSAELRDRNLICVCPPMEAYA